MCSKIYNFIFLVLIQPLLMIAEYRFDQIISHILYGIDIFLLGSKIQLLTVVSKLKQRLFDGT